MEFEHVFSIVSDSVSDLVSSQEKYIETITEPQQKSEAIDCRHPELPG